MRIGVDLGGTKVEAVVLGDQGEIVTRRRRPTPRESYADTLRAIVDLVRELESELGEHASVGVATPGAISPHTGLIKNANSTHLIGERLDVDLSEALDRRVRVANDANCFALSEAVDGAAQGARRGQASCPDRAATAGATAVSRPSCRDRGSPGTTARERKSL
jgi:fructokinase